MELAEKGSQLAGWNIEIVATDFARFALQKARKGIYSQFEVQRGLPISLLVKYFTKADGGWEICPGIRSRVQFAEHNLVTEHDSLGTFDLIFCRNVLLYFDEVTKRAVLSRLAGRLASDGYLVLGSAETTTGLSTDFTPAPGEQHDIFVLSPQTQAARAWLEQGCRGHAGGGSLSGAAAYATAKPAT